MFNHLAGWATPTPLLRRKSGLEILAAGLISPLMELPKTPRQRTHLYVETGRRVSAAECKVRLAERDRQLANDTRTDAQRWLGDPPANRSALARREARQIIDQLISSLRRK